ncbi:MAG: DUF4197 domain-containing protein [Desulfuromonadaceae bacterium]
MGTIMEKRMLAVCSLVVILVAGCAEMQGQNLAGTVMNALSSAGGQGGVLDEATVASGLKEALQVGSERAVATTSRENGFWGNELIRIAMPEQLTGMAKTLRSIGLGSQVDAFEVGMNRAAEVAAAEAKPVLLDAVSQMTLPDAMGILRGGDTAATDYFRDKTSASLRQKFIPIIQEKMGQVGLYSQYNQLLKAYSALPFVTKPAFDLDGYVADRGLDGLFAVLAQKEQDIRANPAARTTELLKRVFSQ